MNDNAILTQATNYVKRYRDSQGGENTITRGDIGNATIIAFLGDGLDECKTECENTMNNLFLNCDNALCIFDIDCNAEFSDIQSIVQNLANHYFLNSDFNTLKVNIVTQTNEYLSKKIFDIIFSIYSEFEFTFSNFSFYIYSIFEKGNKQVIESFAEHLTTIENDVFDKINNYPVYSIIIGDTLTSSGNTAYQDAVASSIVLTSVKNISRDYGIDSKSHSVIGYSQADISLETIYIIGFDIFSDILIDYFRTKGQSSVENSSFDIKQNLLSNYTNEINNLKQQLKSNSNYLYHKNNLENGNYSFCKINEDYGNVLLTYFNVNMQRKNIETPNDDDIAKYFNNYLLEYSKKHGLKKAIEQLERITNNEKQNKKNNVDTFNDIENQVYSYTSQNPDKTIAKIIDDIAENAINSIVEKARNIIVLIGENHENILQKREKVFNDIEICTEKCKQESVYRDKSLNDTIKSAYETVVKEKKDDIQLQLKDGVIDDSIFLSKDSFLAYIFSEYEDKMVSKHLFANLTNYADDISLLDSQGISSWIKRQCYNASSSMDVAAADVLQRPIFLTDIVKNDEFNHTYSQLTTYIKNNNCQYVSVSGVPVFRTLCYRIVKQQDLTLVQRLNKHNAL